MTGAATITPHAAGQFDYRELGQLRLPDGRALDAERRYVFEEMDSGFAVFFAETPPRLFHRIALRTTGPSLVGAATHLCADDRYDSRYEFRAEGSFVVEHRVSGRRKRYTSVTRYTRASI
jgi:hypothetical protein